MAEHELKCWPEFFRPLLSGEKTFEVRRDDRGFRVGDILWLREYVLRPAAADPGCFYTGREMRRTVTYILAGRPWLAEGYVVMGLAPVQPAPDGERVALREQIARTLFERTNLFGPYHECQAAADVLLPLLAAPDALRELADRWQREGETLIDSDNPGSWIEGKRLRDCAVALLETLATEGGRNA
jgi:hypothetical protein